MSKLEQLINELCPDGVEYKRIDEICTITRGRVMSKDYIRDNQGEYPVYSSQTENNGELGKISTYDFDGEYLTWTTDGANAGSVFYRNGKFSVTNVCGLIKVASNLISTKFLFHKNIFCKTYIAEYFDPLLCIYFGRLIIGDASLSNCSNRENSEPHCYFHKHQKNRQQECGRLYLAYNRKWQDVDEL